MNVPVNIFPIVTDPFPPLPAFPYLVQLTDIPPFATILSLFLFIKAFLQKIFIEPPPEEPPAKCLPFPIPFAVIFPLLFIELAEIIKNPNVPLFPLASKISLDQ